MSKVADGAERHRGDAAPGDKHRDGHEAAEGLASYAIGLLLAVVLTAASFYLASSKLVYGPAIPAALIVFGIAQMGVHLVFFLHMTTAPDNINNALALAFGVLIVMLLIGGSLFIMTHLNHNMMPMDKMMQMQR